MGCMVLCRTFHTAPEHGQELTPAKHLKNLMESSHTYLVGVDWVDDTSILESELVWLIWEELMGDEDGLEEPDSSSSSSLRAIPSAV